eukprot:TRINITY_DN21890_c0_g1_i1.p1 TRINITY_DN21890_c0_g1~~TRINITY_DN21890_c0_g1_i1.p1  ORF type:complete len:257 (+),score=54.22 TRINITY_DN21890_c0_g1_i1:53-823(+)
MPHFYVQTLTGKSVEINARDLVTVLDLKLAIQDKEGIPPDQQRLIYSCPKLVEPDIEIRNQLMNNGLLRLNPETGELHSLNGGASAELNDGNDLASYHLKGGEKISLVLRLRGGMLVASSGRDDFGLIQSKPKVIEPSPNLLDLPPLPEYVFPKSINPGRGQLALHIIDERTGEIKSIEVFENGHGSDILKAIGFNEEENLKRMSQDELIAEVKRLRSQISEIKRPKVESDWACNVCTLLNAPHRKRCEVCASEKP